MKKTKLGELLGTGLERVKGLTSGRSGRTDLSGGRGRWAVLIRHWNVISRGRSNWPVPSSYHFTSSSPPSPEKINSLFYGWNREQDLVTHSSANFLSFLGQSKMPAKITYSTMLLCALSFERTDRPHVLSLVFSIKRSSFASPHVLRQRFWKRGSWTHNTKITWALVRNADSQDPS